MNRDSIIPTAVALTFALSITLEAAPRITTSKSTYAVGENIEVTFSGFLGEKKDWITVVPVGAHDKAYRQYFYLRGERSGTRSFAGLKKPGAYEIRGFFDWPRGGYTIQARCEFRVSAGSVETMSRQSVERFLGVSSDASGSSAKSSRGSRISSRRSRSSSRKVPSVPSVGMIAYVTGDRSDQRLVVLSLSDGGTLEAARFPKGQLGDIAWSPDSSRIAFTARVSMTSDIFVYDLSSRKVHRLTESSGFVDSARPSWSPDGRRLAYSSGEMLRRDIWVVAADGSGPATPLTNQQSLPGDKFDPRWSPRGDHVLFLTRRAIAKTGGLQESDIYVASTTGAEVHNVTSSPGRESDAVWVRGSRGTISYTYQPIASKKRDVVALGNPGIWVTSVDGGRPRRLSKSEHHDFAPSWAPDGAGVAFVSSREVGWDGIFAFSRTGQRARRVSPKEYRKHVRPSWSPGGQHILYLALEGRAGALTVAPASGGSAIELASNVYDFAWSPSTK